MSVSRKILSEHFVLSHCSKNIPKRKKGGSRIGRGKMESEPYLVMQLSRHIIVCNLPYRNYGIAFFVKKNQQFRIRLDGVGVSH
jgi:hypothetical protein